MTPGARVAAAIALLDQIQAGAAAEQALTAWARGSRFAGSKDRAAVRDHVFDVLRAKRSLGDGEGRVLMQRLALREGWDIDALFSGEGHAPAPLSDAERRALAVPLSLADAARCDVPDWLWPLWQRSLGAQAEAVATAQQARAEVFLRVNRRKATVDEAIDLLAQDAIATEGHPTIAGCLRVTQNPRRIKTSAAYQKGWVELQDAASQAAVAQANPSPGARFLDYCAGGGGKALAFADQYEGHVFAHDIAPQRLRDLPVRAARAGVDIPILTTTQLTQQSPFDLVFCDAPCSGSGTWRRTPDAKWQFTNERLDQLKKAQTDVLEGAAPLVAAGGTLIYATCSVLQDENLDSVERFQRNHPEWRVLHDTQRLPDGEGDGFYTCVLVKQ